jgi:chromosome segregation ATPase
MRCSSFDHRSCCPALTLRTHDCLAIASAVTLLRVHVQAEAVSGGLEQRGCGTTRPAQALTTSPSQPQLQVLQIELEATRREVAHLQAALAASERQREEVAGQLAAERAQAAAQRAQESSIASSHRELQEAWKGMVDELKAQLKVRGGCHNQDLASCSISQAYSVLLCCTYM